MYTINHELLKAVSANDLETAGTLLAEGADATAVDPAKFLLVEQDSMDIPRGEVGNSALYIAADKGFGEMAQLLLAYGANIEAADQFRQTPLSIAAFRGHSPLVSLLLAHGADIEARNQYGDTPLQAAEGFGFDEIARLLLELGAHPAFRSKTAHRFIAQFGDSPTSVCEQGETLLYHL